MSKIGFHKCFPLILVDTIQLWFIHVFMCLPLGNHNSYRLFVSKKDWWHRPDWTCETSLFQRISAARMFTNLLEWWKFRNGLDQSYYCVADPIKVSDTCERDSGRPLQIIRRNLDLSTVVGVVSTGLPCGSWKISGIYTRVAYFMNWIESHVWPNGEIATPLINQAALYQ